MYTTDSMHEAQDTGPEPARPRHAQEAELQGYGLTENQAKAYSALLELGRATAGQLNKMSGVPRNKVYSVVEELNEKGLVDIHLEDPILFQPLPIAQYLDSLVSGLSARQDQLRGSRPALEAEFQLRRILSEEDLHPGTFKIVKGRRAVVQQLLRMDREAKESARILATPATTARVIASGALSELGETNAHPVNIEMYTPLTEENQYAVESFAERIGEGLRVTYGTSENVAIKIIDDRVVMFVHFLPDSNSVVSGDDVGLWSDNPIFVEMAKRIVQEAANKSMSLESAKALIDAGAETPSFELLSTPKEVRKVALKQFARAKMCSVALRLDDLQQGAAILPRLDGSETEDGAHVRLLTDALPEELMDLPWTSRIEIRHVDRVPSRLGIFDGHVLRAYAVDPEETTPLAHPGSVTVSTNLASLVEDARDHFERLWAAAEPVEIPEALIARNRQEAGPAPHTETATVSLRR